jgi:neutral ceramidase
MRRRNKVLLALCLVLGLLLLTFLSVIGPWPAYSDSRFEKSGYYKAAVAAIADHAAASELTASPGPLKVGWAQRSITPAIGAPLGGYSARPGTKASTGVRDPLHVRAMAISDGHDTAVLVGSDLLIVPPNLAELVRTQVAARCPLTADDLLFNASHTHCGPGGFAPGLAAEFSAGPYDPTMPGFLAAGFTEAIVAAYEQMEPAKIAHGGVDAPEFIRNRVRKTHPVDPGLSFLVAEQLDGDRCYLVSYSAHPTTFGEDMSEFSAEYPGELMAFIEANADANAVYLGGAVGSMGPRAPEGGAPSDRVRAMGQALAQLVLDGSKDLQFSSNLDVASIGIPLGMPSMQMRPFENSPGWRLSPLAASFAGVPNEGWMQGVRVGSLLFMAMPCDFGGEISIKWKAWAQERGHDLWTLSFCGAYCGYFSPDSVYNELPLNYETGLMSWYGPNVEAYFTALFHHFTAALTGAPPPPTT